MHNESEVKQRPGKHQNLLSMLSGCAKAVGNRCACSLFLGSTLAFDARCFNMKAASVALPSLSGNCALECMIT